MSEAEPVNTTYAKNVARAKKYGVIIAPCVIFGSFCSLLTSNEAFRDFMEPHTPKLVQLLREHVGFEKDNAPEIASKKNVLEYQQKNVTAQISYSDGRVESISVPGAQSYDALKLSVGKEAFPSKVHDICFADDISEMEESFNDKVSDGKLVDEKNIYAFSSLWSDVNKTDEHPTGDHLVDSITRYSSNNFICQQLFTQTILQNGMYVNIVNSLGYFHAHSNLDEHYHVRSHCYHSRDEKRKASMTGNSKQNKKLEAVEAVKDIEVRINELELSKVSSNRSIDDINDEIKKFQQEKAKIQREHINYFYYF